MRSAATAEGMATNVHARAGYHPLRWVEICGIVVLWVFYALLTVGTAVLDLYGSRPDALPYGAVTRLLVNPAVWCIITTGGLWLIARYPLSNYSWRRVVLLAVLGVLVANGADLVADATWDAIVLPGAHGRVQPRFRPGLGNFTWLDDFGVYVVALGVGAARAYVIRNSARRDAARRREAELEAESARHSAKAAQLHSQLSEARLQALRRQLDPHFLFNTLHSVSALAERDPRGVRRMIGQLSDLLRHSMDDGAAPEIPLRQELALLERYVDIMRVRFEDDLTVEMCIDPLVLDALVPNLVLQPLVENAIKHGVEQRVDGGRVEIGAARDGGTLVLRVFDNGPGPQTLRVKTATVDPIDESTRRIGVGLTNTEARLAALYGSDCFFSLGPAPHGGTLAEVRIPYRTSTGGATRVD